MIFDVISSTVSVNKWGEQEGTRGLSFEVVPKDREYLEIGDKYVLSSAGYHKLLHRERDRIVAKVHVTADRSHIERKGEEPDKDVCGWASFYPEHQGQLDYTPPALEIAVVVEPHLFEELFTLRIEAPDAATMHVGIEDIEYGWEPDGTHKIWKLDGKRADRLAERKPIKSFWLNVRTFSTSESARGAEEDRKHREELAESPDPEERKLADDLAPAPKEDAATQLLRQCRMILLALLVLAAIAVFRR